MQSPKKIKIKNEKNKEWIHFCH